MNATQEVWKPIVGFEGEYEVSNLGRVRTVEHVVVRRNGIPQSIPARIRKTYAHPKTGHLAVRLRSRDRVFRSGVHQLVLEAFVGPRPEGHEGCHHDGDPTNNRLDNLHWGTKSENNLDRVRHGTHHNANKTECPRGHRLTHPNLITSKLPKRECLACSKAYHRKRRNPALDLTAEADRLYAQQ